MILDNGIEIDLIMPKNKSSAKPKPKTEDKVASQKSEKKEVTAVENTGSKQKGSKKKK